MKIFGLTTLMLFSIQLITYTLFAEQDLYYSVISNRETQALEEPKILLIADYSMQIDISRVRINVEGDYGIIDYENIESLKRYYGNEVVIYLAESKITNYFTANVFEANVYKEIGDNDIYAEDYKSKYFWFLFMWINLSHVNSGQT